MCSSDLRARRVPGPSGDDEGVVATDVSLHGLDRFLRELRLPANGLAFIVDADGHLIATSSTPHLADAPDGAVVRRQAAHSGDHRLSAVYRAMAPRLAEGIASSRPLMLRVDGNETLAAAVERFADGNGLHWMIGVVVPTSTFTGGVANDVNRTVTICCAVALLTIHQDALIGRASCRERVWIPV